MEDVRRLVPTSKDDLDRARAAAAAGYPAVEPILDKLVEWIQDYNWPVAQVLVPFLQTIGEPLVPHIDHVLRTDDDVWKSWVITLLIPTLPVAAASVFRAELERLRDTPNERERAEGLDVEAREVLEQFGWS